VWLRLLFKVLFTQKCIEIIFFFIFKKLFLISAHQNDIKTYKKINLKQRKNNFFFKNAFKTQKQSG
jgi:hypothetical protein